MEKITEIKQFLDSERGNWPKIAKRSGVSYWWILKFMSKKSIANPGYDKIHALSEIMGRIQ